MFSKEDKNSERRKARFLRSSRRARAQDFKCHVGMEKDQSGASHISDVFIAL